MKTNSIIKIATLALLLIAGAGMFQAKAQYRSFFGDSLTIYNVQGMGVSKGTSTDDIELIPGNTYDYWLYTNDTVNINGHRYYWINTFHWEYLREDTATGRIYRYDPDYEEEILTCDMSLSVGDTFWMPFDKSYYYDSRPVPIVVDTIYFVNGLKTIQFRTIYECSHVYWSNDPTTPCPTLFGVEVHHHPIIFVEGIGPNFSPFGWLNDAFEECNGSCFTGEQELHCGYAHWNPFLLCVYKDGELAFMSDAQIGCWQDNNISIQENQPLPFSIHPNPATHTLTVETASPIRTLTVYDLAGRVMMTADGGANNHSPLQIMDVSSLPNGIYLLRAVTDSGVETGRFVKN